MYMLIGHYYIYIKKEGEEAVLTPSVIELKSSPNANGHTSETAMGVTTVYTVIEHLLYILQSWFISPKMMDDVPDDFYDARYLSRPHV